jgi:hypothetical protein
MRKLSVCLAVSVLCSGLSGQTLSSITELAHPDAKVLVGVNVRQLRESAVAEPAKQAWTEQLKAFGAMGQISGSQGLELLNDIDMVLISSPGEKAQAVPAATAAGSPRPAAPARKNPPFVAVLQGNFPAAHYQTLLQGPKRTFRGFAVYKTSKTEDAVMAIVDEHTLVLGDEKSLFAALDRRGRGSQEQAELANRAATLAAENDVWLVVSDLASAIPSSAGPNAAMATQFASQLDALEMGLALRDGLKLNLSLLAKSEATVQMLAGLLGSQLQMMAAQQGSNPEAADVLKRLNVAAQGNRLSVSVSMTKEELDQQIRKIQTARLNPRALNPRPAADGVSGAKSDVTISPPPANRSAQTSVAQPANQPAPAPAELQGPRKVRIFGLEGGVKEIPLGK